MGGTTHTPGTVIPSKQLRRESIRKRMLLTMHYVSAMYFTRWPRIHHKDRVYLKLMAQIPTETPLVICTGAPTRVLA